MKVIGRPTYEEQKKVLESLSMKTLKNWYLECVSAFEELHPKPEGNEKRYIDSILFYINMFAPFKEEEE